MAVIVQRGTRAPEAMTHALGIVLPLAVAIAIFPVPVIAAGLLLISSDHGRAKSVAFVLAWCTSLAVIGAIVLLLADTADASDAGEPARWVKRGPARTRPRSARSCAQKLAGSPRARPAGLTPGWMQSSRRLHDREGRCRRPCALRAQPEKKRGADSLAAAAEIAAVGLPPDQQVAGKSCSPSSSSAISIRVLIPLTVSLALGDGSRALLDNLKCWMARNNAVIMTVLLSSSARS